MKLKLGLLFVIFSVLAVFGVFYAKDYISYDVMRPQQPLKDIKNVSVLKELRAGFVDYRESSIAKNALFEDVEKLYSNGDLVIIHFWASWCAPCVNEIPEIIQFMSKQSDQEHKIHFFAVSLDSDLEDIQKFLKSFPELDRNPFIRIWDKDNSLSKYFDVDKLPATVIFQKTKPYRKINGVVEWAKISL